METGNISCGNRTLE